MHYGIHHLSLHFEVGAETGYGEALDRSSYGSYASSYNECPGIPIALLLITLIGIGNTANRPFYQILQQILVDSVLQKSRSLTIPCCLTQSMLGSSSLWSLFSEVKDGLHLPQKVSQVLS